MFDDTAPLVFTTRAGTENETPPQATPVIQPHAPRRAAIHRAVKRPDTSS